MQTLTPKQRRLLSAFLAGAAVACGLLVATWLYVPTLSELSMTSKRAGTYVYTSAAVRSYASSSLEGVALYCNASILGAGATCGFAGSAAQISGQQVSVEEARVRTLWGSVNVVVRATRNGAVFYTNPLEEIIEDWRSISLFLALLIGSVVANARYVFYRY